MKFPRMFLCIMLGLFTTSVMAENVPKIEDSEFDQSVKVIGLHLFDNPFGGIIKEWFLRSFIDKKTKAVSHQLYVQLNYKGEEWHFYTMAADDSATSLNVEKIDRNVDNCSDQRCYYVETLGVSVSDKALRAHVVEGYRIRLSSKVGSEIILGVSPSQIQPQLDAIDAHLAAMSFKLPAGVPHLGFGSVPVGAHLARATGLPVGCGTLVLKIEAGSPAETAGVNVNDLITRIDGLPVGDFDQLRKALAALKGKHKGIFAIERNGEAFDIPLEF